MMQKRCPICGSTEFSEKTIKRTGFGQTEEKVKVCKNGHVQKEMRQTKGGW